MSSGNSASESSNLHQKLVFLIHLKTKYTESARELRTKDATLDAPTGNISHRLLHFML
jgi:hypothetical protein